MKCLRCQHENAPEQKFCGECGARLTAACSVCGASNPPEQKFCGECGSALGSASTARFASPQQYIPKHLVDRILTSKSALEGERKQVTVLFADLKGSMELLADRDPEEARALLDPVLERMRGAVHRYEGTVNQVMGDGIMALFGAPLALEDHAVRACYSALAMQAAIRAYSEELTHTQGIAVHIRVGLNSGEVVVRAISNDLHMDYTAVGQTTHLAARMEQLASQGSTLLTENTLRVVEGFFVVSPRGPVPVKGLAEPIQVYELTSAGAARNRLQAAALRGLTHFVGRTEELAQLNKALDQARAGRGQVVSLVGEPGVGKSRLVWEFTRSHRTRDWLVLQSGSVSYGKASPYRPLIDLLKAYFEIAERDDARRIREKVTGKLFTLDESFKPVLPAFYSLLDVAVDEAAWIQLDSAQKRLRTLEACKRLLLREAQVQPLLVVFEDLHWIDSETQAFLDGLVDGLPTTRILLLVNYRPEYENKWTTKTYYSQYRIDALTPESAEALLHSLIGNDSSLQALKYSLVERTEGNPLFLEECVRTLIETAVLQGSRRAYRLNVPVGNIQMPATVQAILAARIDRLSVDDKHLLQAAAVVGKDVPHVLLQAIVDGSEEQLRQTLENLQASEFLYEASVFPDVEYTFKHALTHEVAYSSLLQERRRGLHAAIVQAMERIYGDRLLEHVERLAQHALRGETWEKAFRYFRQAGVKALERSVNRQAVECFDQALAVTVRLPPVRNTLEQTVDLHFELRSALHALGEFERLVESLREAERVAESLADQRRIRMAAGFRAFYFILMGDHVQSIGSARRALTIAEETGNLAVKVVSINYLGLAHFYLGHYPKAIAFHTQNAELLDGEVSRQRFDLPAFPAVLCRSYLAWSFGELGNFAEGSRQGEDGVQLAGVLKHPFSVIWAEFSLGYLYLRQGRLEAALRSLEHGLTLCRQNSNMPFVFPLVATILGAVYTCLGRREEALAMLEEALQAALTMRLMLFRPLLLGFLGEVHFLSGHVAEAKEYVDSALRLSQARTERGWEAWTLKLIGEFASHPDLFGRTEAERSYRSALAIATDLNMRPLAAHCNAGLGKLYKRTGERDSAQQYLSAASRMFRDLDMQSWAERTDAALAD